MSIPPRLAGRLNDVLGADAADDLVNWMDEMRADHAELRHEMHTLRADLAALNKKTEEGFKAMDAKFDRLLENSFTFGQRLESLRGHFIAWNAAFWLSAVTVTVGLLQFLRH